VETVPEDGQSEVAESRPRRRRTGLIAGIGLGAAALLLAVAVGPLFHLVGAGSPATSAGGPTGGLTRDQAIALVRQLYEPSATTLGDLIYADAGPFATVSAHRAEVPAGSGAGVVAPDRRVWFFTFNATSGEICPPFGGACESSRPGFLNIAIDYYTGELLLAMGMY
jgi:hypothetical protein